MNLFDLLAVIGKSLDGTCASVPAVDRLTASEHIILRAIVELSGTLIYKTGRGEPVDASVQKTLLE